MDEILSGTTVSETLAGAGASGTKPVLSMAEAEELARRLAKLVRQSAARPDIVVGIGNGGVHPAFYTAQALDLPCRIYLVQRGTGRLKRKLLFMRRALRWRIARPLVYKLSQYADRWLTGIKAGPDTLQDHVRGKQVLLVDDCIDSGASMALVKALLQQRGADEILIAVYCWTTKVDSLALHGIAPDFYLGRRLLSFPWSADNPEYPAFKTWLRDHSRSHSN